MIKVVIAVGEELIKEGLISVLEKQKGVLLIGHAATGHELIDVVRLKQPDVVIADAILTELDGIELTRKIRKQFPRVCVIALAKTMNTTLIMDMIEAGARGYLLKNASITEVLEAIQTVAGGGQYFSKEIAGKLISIMARGSFYPYRPSAKPRFSNRELEIIHLICQQYSSKEIGALLNIHGRSIESCRERIQRKIGAKNMIGIALYAVKNGLYSID